MKTVWSIDISAPRERVWEELTKRGEVMPFYFGSVLEGDLRPGGSIRYVSSNGKRAFIVGEVVEFTPPAMFSHTFRFTDLGEAAQTVTFELDQIGESTRLTVRHEGLDLAPKHGRRVGPGWTKILSDLKSWTEHGNVPFGSRFRNAIMKLMLPLMPKHKG